MLRLSSDHHDPEAASADIAEQLLSSAPDRWVADFGWKPESIVDRLRGEAAPKNDEIPT